MAAWLRQSLAPPRFEGDEEKTHFAGLLHTTLLTLLAGALLYIVFAPLVATIFVERLPVAGMMIGLLLLMLVVLRFGYIRFASVTTVLGIWVLLTLAAITNGGVRSPAFNGYLIVLLCAGVLLGRRAAIGVAGISIVAGLAMVVVSQAGALPSPVLIHSDTSIWITESVYLAVAAMFLSLALSRINVALGQARRELAERARAEQALRQNELLLRGIIDNSAALIYVKRPDGRYVLINHQYEKIFGVTLDQVRDRTDYHVFDRQVADVFRANDQQAYLAGTALQFEEYTPQLDGQHVYLSVKFPILDANGQAYAVCGISTDITDRKRAEEALRASEEQLRENEKRYRAISELVSDYAFAYRVEADGSSKLEWVTDAMTRITGFAPEETSDSDHWMARTHPDDIPIAQRRRQRIHAGEPDVSEYRSFAKDGRLLWLRYYSRPEWDAAHSSVERVYGAVQDITKLKQLEQQLAQSQKLEAIGRLAGGIAHDFNNLLTVILSNCDFMLSDLDDPQALRQDVEQTSAAAARAATLTQQLLAFSRQQLLQPRVFDLNAVVREISALLHRMIGVDIELITRLAPDLGRVKADPGQIEQVIMNLALNARDAMPNGGTLLIATGNADFDEAYTRDHVNVSAGPYVMLSVSDTGSGMDVATRSRIFDPFFTTKEQGKGTGLGLATVHGIVNQSGGHIWVYSEPGHGSTFKIYLPRIEEPVAASVLSAPPQLARGSETILLAEDDQQVRELASRILREQGYQVLEAADGLAALRIAAQRHDALNLLLTDLIMPGGLGGHTLAEQVQLLCPTIKILYMSGYSDDMILRDEALGASILFLPKPFTPIALLLKVREVLDD